MECLDAGLPPLSRNANDIVDMICRMSGQDRRSVNRKIRKVCKTAITTHCINSFKRLHNQRFEKNRLLNHLGFNTTRNTFDRPILLKRIHFLQSYMRSTLKQNT